MNASSGYVLTLSCPDRMGIVHAVSGFLLDLECNIADSQQFLDPGSARFFLRVHFESSEPQLTMDALHTRFMPVAARFGMDWQLYDVDVRPRMLVMVSRYGHCLNDLLFRCRSGQLAAEVAAVVSNHPDLEPLATSHGIPYHHLPVTPETKAQQENRVLELAEEHKVDLVVLARYMQVLTDRLCAPLSGRIINIHHSFLPSFQGARPYQQAYERGVKLIGATAHYVTPELDEGPIIEQEVARVDHTRTPAQLASVGQDVECVTLARAVRWHIEHRVLLNGNRTVVFP